MISRADYPSIHAESVEATLNSKLKKKTFEKILKITKFESFIPIHF